MKRQLSGWIEKLGRATTEGPAAPGCTRSKYPKEGRPALYMLNGCEFNKIDLQFQFSAPGTEAVSKLGVPLAL